jgi:uncharacterized protein YjbI with pentapeptide repeats
VITRTWLESCEERAGDWARRVAAELNSAELNWAELDRAELDWAELDRAELNWAELN